MGFHTFEESCKAHNLPLTLICNDCKSVDENHYICELCGVQKHKGHEVEPLRLKIEKIICDFKEYFEEFKNNYKAIKESKIFNYKETIYIEVDQFFRKLHLVVDHYHVRKRSEIKEGLSKLKIQDLADLSQYNDLYDTVKRADQDLNRQFKELSFAKIHRSQEKMEQIQKAISIISEQLEQAHATYLKATRELVKVNRNDKELENIIAKFINQNCQTEFSGQEPPLTYDSEIRRLVQDLKTSKMENLDDMVSILHTNKHFMKQVEVKTICTAVRKVIDPHEEETLLLDNKNISDYGADVIGQALKTNTTITSLSLKHNGLTDFGIASLSDSLRLNQGLKSICLSYNRIGSTGCESLMHGLRSNKFVKTLYLDNNQIDDIGAQFISQLMIKNQTIQTLYLNRNLITDTSCESLGLMIKKNSTLVHLFLNDNQIEDKGVNILVDNLSAEKPVLQSLTLFNNLISDLRKDEIKLLYKHRVLLYNALT